MWVLDAVKGLAVERIYLYAGHNFLVGRKDCEVLIEKDPSISRKHAVFTVTHTEANLGNPVSLPSLTVKDSSKYGTMVSDVKVSGAEGVSLKDGDVIVFGTHGSSVRVRQIPLVVMASCLDSNKKKRVKELLLQLGGHLVKDWQIECTHLVMEGLSFTHKVIHALVCGLPIVESRYLEVGILDRIKNKGSPADTKEFFPPIKEPSINPGDSHLFQPNPQRNKLFKDKTFIMLSKKQCQTLQKPVELAGGKVTLLTSPQQVQDPQIFLSSHSLVLLVDARELSSMNTQMQTWVKQIFEDLRGNGLRPIPESEVGLAILYLSVDQYCNPRIKRGSSKSQVLQPGLTSATQASALSQLSMPVKGLAKTEAKKRVRSSSDEDSSQIAEKKPQNQSTTVPGDKLADVSRVSETQGLEPDVFDDDETQLGDPQEGKSSDEDKSKGTATGEKVVLVSDSQEDDTRTNGWKRKAPTISETQVDGSDEEVMRSKANPSLKRMRVSESQLDEGSPSVAGWKSKGLYAPDSPVATTRIMDKGKPRALKSDTSKELDPVRKGVESEADEKVKAKLPSRQILASDSPQGDNKADITHVSETQGLPLVFDTEVFDRTIDGNVSIADTRGVKKLRVSDSQPEGDGTGVLSKGQDTSGRGQGDNDGRGTEAQRRGSSKGSRGSTGSDAGQVVPESLVRNEKDESFCRDQKESKVNDSLQQGTEAKDTTQWQREGSPDKQSETSKAEVRERLRIKQEELGFVSKRRRSSGKGEQNRSTSEPGMPWTDTQAAKKADQDIVVKKENSPDTTIKTDPDELDVPRDLVIIQHVSLMVRQPGYSRVKVPNLNGNVKNFKKFKKQWYVGCDKVVPTIIGGSDLVVNQRYNGQRDEWFQQQREVLSQRDERDKAGEDLFRLPDKLTKQSARGKGRGYRR